MTIDTSALDRWIVRFPRANRPRLRLFCLPYAGGGTLVYRRWLDHLPGEIELCAVLLPGREQRLNEAPMADVVGIAAVLAKAIERYSDLPFAFFGHSMGAGIAYETSLAIARMSGRGPSCLMASARRAPHLPPKRSKRLLGNDEIIEELKRLNGTPPEVLETPELMEFMLPVLRSDFQLAYGYVAPAIKLPCPVIAFGGRGDSEVSREELESWRELSGATFGLHMLDGDHFFINSRRGELIALIVSELQHLWK